ncbi:homoserine kinase [Skermania piniformis]|uniref:Homoserine kinase n=1 Tax=Skermania pinensis TaxID=39122 RepID=A0ABX8SA65_9ACTN|nr:homoserine kinase [Skermania piniformis]QXQ14748.1 homoserine kinase [Skermania piniformis]
MTRTLPVGTTVTARVPASSANLGAGFDTFGIALGLYDEITVTVTSAGLTVRVVGEGAGEVPLGDGHLVVRAVQRGLRAAGVAVDGLDVLCRNCIPHSRGLGSSASAAVGGLVAASGLAAKLDPGSALTTDRLIQLAGEFEGHPDNSSASILGGVVVSWTEPDPDRGGPRYRAVRLDPHPALRATALVPPHRSSTSHTRMLLPDLVPHADAVFNVSRAALAVVAVTHRPDLLIPATEDRLHQPQRAAAIPVTTEWVGRLRAAGIAATVSGAGPAVLALTLDELPTYLREQAQAAGLQVLDLPLCGGVTVE